MNSRPPAPTLWRIAATMTGLLAMNTAADNYEQARQEMVYTIKQQVVETASYIERTHLDERVIHAMATVPRHNFVPPVYQPLAYHDAPLSIGHRQTISQPYIVALMTDLLKPQADQVVLEIGTGSGYQAAVLSLLVKQVYSIEIVPALAAGATQTLAQQGYHNVTVRAGDGYQGWPEQAPFDGIMVTAGGDIPPLLLEQLKPGGRMIIPVGGPSEAQYLTVIEKNLDGQVSRKKLLPVRFVPLINPENN